MRTLLLFLLLSSLLPATEVVQSFKSSAFQSNGSYSNYALSLENVAFTRKQTIIAQKKADAATAAAAAQNTPINQFIANLQARIYSQIAANVTNQIFQNGATQGSFNLPGGAFVSWVVNNGTATLTIFDSTANTFTTLTIPVSSLILSSGGGG
jgi:hypothetical protein